MSLSQPSASPSRTHPTPSRILPAAPCGQQLCSTQFCSALLSSAPGRPPPPCSPPPSPAVTTHGSSLEGVGTPGLDTPHRGPRTQLVGRTHGRTQGPRSPEVGSVPGSLAASSRSVPVGDAATLGSLGPLEPAPGPSSQTSGPKADLTQVHLRQAGPGGRGHPCVQKLAQVRGRLLGRGRRLGTSPSPAHRGLARDTPHRPWGAKIGKRRV